MTLANAFQSQPDPFEWTPFLDGLYHVMRTGRLKTTLLPQMWRNSRLIKADGQDKDLFEERHNVVVSDYAHRAIIIPHEARWAEIGIFESIVVSQGSCCSVIYSCRSEEL